MKSSLTLALASLASASLVATASAGGFVRATSGNLVNGTYQATVDEYRHDPTQRSSLACPASRWSSAPIVIVFGGGTGVGTNISEGFAILGAKLDRACVRLVVVEGITGYASNARPASIANAALRLGDYAANVRFATNAVLDLIYPSARKATYLGGSMSAALGAKMFESEFYRIIAAPSADRWTRLDRFILGGPPLGDLYAGCRYAIDDGRSFMPAIVRELAGASSCASYLAQASAGLGTMFGASSALQRTQLQGSGVRVNFFIGTSDEFFGWSPSLAGCAQTPGGACATGPDGVRNYLDTVALRGMTVERAGSLASPPSPTATTTFTTMVGRTHSSLWDAETSTLVCRLVSYDANNLVNDANCN